MTDNQLPAAEIVDEFRGWVEQGQAVSAARQKVLDRATTAVETLDKTRMVRIAQDGRVSWQVLLLSGDDAKHLRAIAGCSVLPAMSQALESQLGELTGPVAEECRAARAVTGVRRVFAFGRRRAAGERALAQLANLRGRYANSDILARVQRAAPVDDPRIAQLRVENALDAWVGLAACFGQDQASATLEPAQLLAALPNAMELIEHAQQRENRLRSAARDVGNAVRRTEVNQMLAEIPVERLRDATAGRIQVSALTNADITTVGDVIRSEETLELLPGIGEVSASHIRGAARTIAQSTYEEMPIRIDVKKRGAEHTNLLECLRSWDAVRKLSASTTDNATIEALKPLSRAMARDITHAVVFSSEGSTIEGLRAAVHSVIQCARAVANAESPSATGDIWEDFLSRPADYFGLLTELGFVVEDEKKTHGDLPEEIITAVRDTELKIDHLKEVSLRGYQAFGARFALVQRKVIIGDEMGLGKTIEALAVLAHLRSVGQHHTLVICPAAVVTNWVREVRAKSDLPAHRLHGAERERAANSWVKRGGVAVTTYETLPWLDDRFPTLPDVACVVVDEAHYIKNPDAQRSKRAAGIIDSCDRAILMTGTPLENRIDEFRNLVRYLRADLVVDANEFAPKRFRRQVAPAYLRRNQEDVLTELPERIDVDEWLEMSSADRSAYRDAVAHGSFPAMRQAAMLQGTRSSKVQRLREIVEEAEDNGRRVVVFSYFLDVLDRVAAALPGRVFGPLNGRVPAQHRQAMIDDFAEAPDGSVLVSQIMAGGVGLNIQTASVVIICEPQLKPTTEWQAIARAHRMGQVHNVQVHRLLSDEGADVRVHEILAEKIRLFGDFARDSDLAQTAPEAVDVSEADLAREVIAAERERLFGQPGRGAAAEARSG